MAVNSDNANQGGHTVIENGRTITISLEPDERSVPQARIAAGRALDRWGLPDLADDVRLVVSELVTNAMRLGTTLTLTLTAHSGAVGIEVTDGSPKAPRVTPARPYDESGRGLLLVRHLAKGWGVRWDRGVPGRPPKTVWAVISR